MLHVPELPVPEAAAEQSALGSAPAALPPHDEVVEGCRTFISSYFQLGFLPKAIFIESLTHNPAAASTFLLSCILSISARFTPALVHRYGTASKATAHFLSISRSMVPTEMYKPSLERTQAFFLLAISEWGNGDKDRSSMDMGVAVRMATLLKLHREETYQLPMDATAEQIVRAESARRTFWMIQSQENLHSGYSTPGPFPLEDITAYLPCDEPDFAFAIVPAERSVLEGTPPAAASPALAASPHRCLFATLVQAHNIWGQIARRACRPEPRVAGAFAGLPPWDNRSEFAGLATRLRQWEVGLPARQKWSVWNLRGWRAESLHLAYLAVVMVNRLSNIVARRLYLDDMIATLNHETSNQAPPAPAGFWEAMATDLFGNVQELYEQIDSYFSMRAKEEGFPAILVFSVYTCGSLLSFLWKFPGLCPPMARDAEQMALRSLVVLNELHRAWPTCARWHQSLQQIASPVSSPAPARGSAITSMGDAVADNHESGRYPSDPAQPNGNVASGLAIDEFPSEMFDAEFAAFLSGDLHYGLGEWDENGCNS
ncbi:hypothetical protein GQ53DRAFT_656048 [Thozetella sp. PMI_491]|nr:hypothetical protein GQ53DRAFT_656048 [Thozetella sp. PMI_491]